MAYLSLRKKPLVPSMGSRVQYRSLTVPLPASIQLQIVSELIHHRFVRRSCNSDYAILYRANHQSRLSERALREHYVPYYLSGGISFFAYAEIKDIMAYLRLLSNPDDDNAFLRIVNTPRREIGPGSVEKLANYAAGRDPVAFRMDLLSSNMGGDNRRSLNAERRSPRAS